MPSSYNAKASSILVVGSLNMDLVVQLETHPNPGDTVLGSDAQTFPGGKGANQAAAAAKVGGQVKMLGRVGTDGYGEELRTALAKVGVNTDLVESVEGSSGLALITVDEAGQNIIVVSPGANRQLSPNDIEERHFEGVKLVLMQLEIPLETVTKVARLAHEQNIPVALNAAPAQELSKELLQNLSYLIVNEGEAAFLSRQLRSSKSADSDELDVAPLLEAGVGAVIVTLGGEGVTWQSDGEKVTIKAHSVEVVDTTAAGDAFCGALAVRLAEDVTLEEAIAFANAAGALATTKAGAQPSLPERGEIERLLE